MLEQVTHLTTLVESLLRSHARMPVRSHSLIRSSLRMNCEGTYDSDRSVGPRARWTDHRLGRPDATIFRPALPKSVGLPDRSLPEGSRESSLPFRDAEHRERSRAKVRAQNAC